MSSLAKPESEDKQDNQAVTTPSIPQEIQCAVFLTERTSTEPAMEGQKWFVGRTDHLPGGAAPNWVSPKQGSGPMARHAVTEAYLLSRVRTYNRTYDPIYV